MAKAKETSAKPKSRGIAGWIGTLVALALLAALLPATTLILAVGLLPTLCAAFLDPTSDRRAVLAVGVPNVAGVLPVIFTLWHARASGLGHGIDSAYALLLEPHTWLLLYGCAGAGTIIYMYVPRMVALFATHRAQAGIDARRDYQQALEKEWGTAVRAPEPEDKAAAK